ncbi:MAG TPA: carboxylesterase family protein [Vicinamibacterales bacterium]|nr:carboxylesterase family protein [Vicinamibacterales bacterium]
MPKPIHVGLVLVAAVAGATQVPKKAVQAQTAACEAATNAGVVRGQDLGLSCQFLGIPYAAPPTAALRWKPPQPPAPWDGVRDAIAPPANCPSVNPASGLPGGSEDCLKLNLWVRNPLPGVPAPVIVWLHAGAFAFASANFPSHRSQRLAEETGVIVVAPNYRLGPFGFLVHEALASEDPARPVSGNYGLLDQRAALAWVHDNIANFGGDPDNVTIAGTSAGGESAGLHLVSPGSAGLFHRAVVHSGPVTARWPSAAEMAPQGDALASALGCTDQAAVLSCLRAVPQNTVLTGLTQGVQPIVEPAGRVFWLPVVDGLEIPDQPRELYDTGQFTRVPVVLGYTRDEGAGAFITRSFPLGVSAAQYDAWLDTEFDTDAPAVRAMYPVDGFATPADAMARVLGDGNFTCEGQRLARTLALARNPVYVFSYEYEIDDLFKDRVIHGVESNILFGNNYGPPNFVPHVLDASDLALHAAMAGYWTRFAATGNPNTDDGSAVQWPPFKAPAGIGRGALQYLVLDAVIEERTRLKHVECAFWEPFFLRSMVAGVPAGQ